MVATNGISILQVHESSRFNPLFIKSKLHLQENNEMKTQIICAKATKKKINSVQQFSKFFRSIYTSFSVDKKLLYIIYIYNTESGNTIWKFITKFCTILEALQPYSSTRSTQHYKYQTNILLPGDSS